MLFLFLFLVIFAALIIFLIVPLLMLMNKRFLFDRLSIFTQAQLQNGQTTEIDIVETTAETEKRCVLTRQERVDLLMKERM